MGVEHRAAAGADGPSLTVAPVERDGAGQSQQFLAGASQQPFHGGIDADDAAVGVHGVDAVGAALQDGLHTLLFLGEQVGEAGRLHGDGRLFGEGGQHRRVELGEVGGVGGTEHEDQAHGLVAGVQGNGHDRVLHFPGCGDGEGRLGEQGGQQRELLTAEGEVGYGLVEQGPDAPDLGAVQAVGPGYHEAAHRVVPGGDHGRAAAQGAHGVAEDSLQFRLQLDGVAVVGLFGVVRIERSGDHGMADCIQRVANFNAILTLSPLENVCRQVRIDSDLSRPNRSRPMRGGNNAKIRLPMHCL